MPTVRQDQIQSADPRVVGFENDSDFPFERFDAAYTSDLVNGYIPTSTPWGLAKAGGNARLDAVLAALAHCLRRLAVMSSPFMSEKSRATPEPMLWSDLTMGETPVHIIVRQ